MSEARVIQFRWRPTIGFATRLRVLRKEYGTRIGQPGLSQVAFATELGVNENTYKQWESGGNRPSDIVAFANRCSEVTACDPAWLLGIETFDHGPDSGPDQGISALSWKDHGTVLPLFPVAA
jgi:transcriptional regulator with XRE-family HTH domain